MLDIIQGVPGSGKSYFSVKRMLEEKKKGVYIITNVSGFKQADEYIDSQESSGLVSFIIGRDWEAFAKSLQGKKIYLVLDEAQRVYPSNGMDKTHQQALLFFLEYHRHYGMNISLVTQSKNSLNSRVMPLVHEIIQVSKVRGLRGEQRIRVHDPVTWELIRSEKFPRDPLVYAAYESSSVETGHQKPSNPLRRIAGLLVLGAFVLLAAGASLVWVIVSFIGGSEPEPSQQVLPDPPVKSSSPAEPPKPSGQKPDKPVKPSSRYVWQAEKFPDLFNSEKCYKSSTHISWVCDSVTNRPYYLRLANTSFCTKNLCTLFFNDSGILALEEERFLRTSKSSSAFDLPSVTDYSKSYIDTSSFQNPFSSQ